MPARPASTAADSPSSPFAPRGENAHGAPPTRRDHRISAAVLAALALATGLVAATGGSPGAFIAELATGGWPVVLWLVAAWGGGRALSRVLGGPAASRSPDDPATNLALGVALLLALDSAVLRLDAGAATVWGITAAGLMAAAWDFWRRRGTPTSLRLDVPPVPGVLLGLAAIPAAVLLASASTAPGWLWSSEFGGYDALSYHLQLPAEWAEAGRSTPLTHNVYAFLPNAVEHAFLHVGRLSGDPRTAGTTAQFLHAAMAIGAAAATAGLAQAVRLRFGAGRRAAQWSGGIAGILVLATPWTLVTGSLAYTEMAVLWMLAASMRLAVTATGRPGLRDGLAHGLLAGAATAAKLTAGPLAVLPAVCWWLAVRRGEGGGRSPRVIGLVAVGGAAAGLAVLAPWLIAGAASTGNPVFPFAADLIGAGHWNAEQVAAWRAGHGGGGGPLDLAREWLVHGVAGDEPAQWGVLPVAGLAAVLGLMAGAIAARRAGTRDDPGIRDARNLAVPVGLAAMLATSAVAWAVLTHAESRFLLPTAVPLALAIALIPGVRRRREGTPAGDRLVLLGVGLGLVAVQLAWSATLAVREQDGRLGLGVGAGSAFRGESWQQSMADARAAGDGATRRELRELAPPTWWVRFGLGPAPRVLMIGEAAVYHHPAARIAYRTVWDRDQLTTWLDAGEDAAGRPLPDDSGWATRATAAGFTHAFIDRIMLANWAERGWNDPRMTWETLRARARRELTVIARFDNGGRVLVRLDGG